jgi:hypothetical protein
MSSKDDSIARRVGEDHRMFTTTEETEQLEKTNANWRILISDSLTSCESSQSLRIQHVLEDQDKLRGWPEATTPHVKITRIQKTSNIR